jgi:hypothetical protein
MFPRCGGGCRCCGCQEDGSSSSFAAVVVGGELGSRAQGSSGCDLDRWMFSVGFSLSVAASVFLRFVSKPLCDGVPFGLGFGGGGDFLNLPPRKGPGTLL